MKQRAEKERRDLAARVHHSTVERLRKLQGGYLVNWRIYSGCCSDARLFLFLRTSPFVNYRSERITWHICVKSYFNLNWMFCKTRR